MPSDQVDAEFSHLMWTNFSGPDRLVSNPFKPLYQGGNTYQRELRYLRDRGYTFELVEDHWMAVPGR